MTIPADILKLLHFTMGETVELDVANDSLIIRAQRQAVRKHYSLKELLRGTTPKAMTQLKRKTAWAREGKSIGRELT